ncbi:MAG: signal protein, partial [Chloroflexi bacterium HGW-Chloroflexi-1]
MGTGKDITERKRAEEALKEKDKFIESMLQSSAVATFVIDSKHNVIYWNKACEDLTGIKSEDLMGANDHWKAFYDHRRPCVSDIIIDSKFDDMANLYKVYAKSVLIPDGLCAEGWYPNLGGKNRYIAFDAAPICDANGKTIAAIETLQDITERKHTEEALRHSLEETARGQRLLLALSQAAQAVQRAHTPD